MLANGSKAVYGAIWTWTILAATATAAGTTLNSTALAAWSNAAMNLTAGTAACACATIPASAMVSVGKQNIVALAWYVPANTGLRTASSDGFPSVFILMDPLRDRENGTTILICAGCPTSVGITTMVSTNGTVFCTFRGRPDLSIKVALIAKATSFSMRPSAPSRTTAASIAS